MATHMVLGSRATRCLRTWPRRAHCASPSSRAWSSASDPVAAKHRQTELPSSPNNSVDAPTRHHQTDYLSSSQQQQDVAFVLLNLRSFSSPATHGNRGESFDFFDRLWQLATFRCCADGAANRLYDGLGGRTSDDHEDLVSKYLPNMIMGDLDSIRPQVRAYYESRGVNVLQDADQNTHDFDKCLQQLAVLQARRDKSNQFSSKLKVVVLGAFGGRLDQQMANLNMLYKWQCFDSLVLLSGESLSFVLEPGSHEIYPNEQLEGPKCALIPLGSRCNWVRTHGLRWDLKGEPLAFGQLVSTSNAIVTPTVTVETDAPLLWTTVLRTRGLAD